MIGLNLIALILVLLLLVWLFAWRRKATQRDRSTPAPLRRPDTAFHAVSIRFESNACKAARELEGERFLSSQAPRLPLPGCNVTDCQCRFIHHRDRRSGRDRRTPFGSSAFGAATGNYEQEQRQGRDRRRSDDDDDIF